MAADILSDILGLLHLTGALMFRLNVYGYWSVTNSATEISSLARLLPIGTDQIIIFHIVTEGECWMRQTPGDWVHTRAGDAVVLAHGAAHDIATRPEAAPVSFREILGERSLLDLRDLRFDLGAGPKVQIVCGFLGCSRRAFAPVCTSLPDFFRLSLDEPTRGLVSYGLAEALSERPGANTLRVRMAELLFVGTLRRYLPEMPEHATGWLAGLRDPVVARAMQALHAAPDKSWTVEMLASQSKASRSCLAARFREVVGEPPMRYLARLRMQHATRYLGESAWSIERIAGEVGYESSAAFKRAFKRHLGMPPAAWRRAIKDPHRDCGNAPLTESFPHQKIT